METADRPHWYIDAGFFLVRRRPERRGDDVWFTIMELWKSSRGCLGYKTGQKCCYPKSPGQKREKKRSWCAKTSSQQHKRWERDIRQQEKILHQKWVGGQRKFSSSSTWSPARIGSLSWWFGRLCLTTQKPHSLSFFWSNVCRRRSACCWSGKKKTMHHQPTIITRPFSKRRPSQLQTGPPLSFPVDYNHLYNRPMSH